MKQCTKCRALKPATREFFSPNKKRRDGLQSSCKACANAFCKAKTIASGGRTREQWEAIQSAPWKACSKCGVEKPNTPEHFRRYSKSPNRLWPWCIDCCRAYRRTDERRAVGREQAKGRRVQRALAVKHWRTSNPEAVKAHRAVRTAKRAGRLVAQPCARCGASGAEAHHHKGYAPEHWLDVEWLCKECHVTEHRGERVAA